MYQNQLYWPGVLMHTRNLTPGYSSLYRVNGRNGFTHENLKPTSYHGHIRSKQWNILDRQSHLTSIHLSNSHAKDKTQVVKLPRRARNEHGCSTDQEYTKYWQRSVGCRPKIVISCIGFAPRFKKNTTLFFTFTYPGNFCMSSSVANVNTLRIALQDGSQSLINCVRVQS